MMTMVMPMTMAMVMVLMAMLTMLLMLTMLMMMMRRTNERDGGVAAFQSPLRRGATLERPPSPARRRRGGAHGPLLRRRAHFHCMGGATASCVAREARDLQAPFRPSQQYRGRRCPALLMAGRVHAIPLTQSRQARQRADRPRRVPDRRATAPARLGGGAGPPRWGRTRAPLHPSAAPLEWRGRAGSPSRPLQRTPKPNNVYEQETF